ncbi:MAG TPA: anti-sigma factor [Verrucomicrobiae bacterium]|nr:anti-sigma factor [Verrucomicrobiae bacterium]
MNAHPTREEDFDLYALGALEGDEKQAIERHVAECAECARKLAEARGRIALLALAAPPVAPSPGAKQQLLRRIHAEDTARISPAAATKAAAAERREFFPKWWSRTMAAAGVAAALAAIFLWTENARLNQRLEKMQASLDQQAKDLHEAREEAEMFESAETRMVALTPMPGHPMTARVLYNAKMGMVMCDVQAPAAPQKMSYQLWVMTKGGPISAGAFNTGSTGWSSWMSDVPKGTQPMGFAITIEPEGGMPHPTGPMVMTTRIS